MPAMNSSPALPACCTPLDAHWPLPNVLPDTVLLSTRFDPKQLLGDDFQRSAIEPPPSIQRSVAKRQAEFLAGGLRPCRAATTGRLNVIPAIGEDRAPVWPAHICGSITHSTGVPRRLSPKSHWRGWAWTWKTCSTRAGRTPGREILTPPELQRMAGLAINWRCG
jgi:enterobactin synthetase component D